MAKYNTFVVQSTRTGRALLVTSSARKVERFPLSVGLRCEVWSDNVKIETIYFRTRGKLKPYTAAEKAYIRAKQEAAENRNKRGAHLGKYQK